MTNTKQPNSQTLITLPAATEVEGAVLGAILNKPELYYEASDTLHDDIFFDPGNRAIWKALSSDVEPSSAVSRLRDMGQLDLAGGPQRIIELHAGHTSAASFDEWIKILIDRWQRRQIITVASSALSNAQNNSADVIMSALEKEIASIADASGCTRSSIDDQINEMIAADMAAREGKLEGLAWPIADLNAATRGIRAGQWYIIIGLFKSGKTKLLSYLLASLAERKVPTLFFSLEMKAMRVLRWMAASRLKIDTSFFGTPRMNHNDMDAYQQWVMTHCSGGHFHIDERSIQTPESMCATIKRMHAKHGIKVVALDYLQRMVWGRYGELSDISRGLNMIAALCKRLDIAMVALSQVPKSAENKGADSLINISDTKDAAAYAEVADCAISINDTTRHMAQQSPTKLIKLLVEQRDGPTELIDVAADLRYGTFNACGGR